MSILMLNQHLKSLDRVTGYAKLNDLIFSRVYKLLHHTTYCIYHHHKVPRDTRDVTLILSICVLVLFPKFAQNFCSWTSVMIHAFLVLPYNDTANAGLFHYGPVRYIVRHTQPLGSFIVQNVFECTFQF